MNTVPILILLSVIIPRDQKLKKKKNNYTLLIVQTTKTLTLPHWWEDFMRDDEEMINFLQEIKNQCFGGEYLGEVFDHMLKRMAYRRQKRWWNAYILFYERQDESEDEKHIYKSLQDLTIGKQWGWVWSGSANDGSSFKFFKISITSLFLVRTSRNFVSIFIMGDRVDNVLKVIEVIGQGRWVKSL